MITFLANPQRFMDFSRWAAPILGALAAVLLSIGFVWAFSVPEDYQQGATVRLLFLHPQIAILCSLIYAGMAGAAFFGVVFRHPLADAAARAAAPLGAGFTFLALVTGSFWGRPMWGTWWEWNDARLDSVLLLLLLFLGYLALLSAIDDEAKATRAANILAMVGVLNLPVIKFSVEWWNTLHQGPSLMSGGISAPYLPPFLLTLFGFAFLFGSLWMVRVRSEVWRRKAGALAIHAAGRA